MQKRCFLLVICLVCGIAVAQTTFSVITIQPKQTLYSIARDYNVPVADLKKLNAEYAPDFKLKIGDKFKIPAVEIPAGNTEKQAENSQNASGTHIVQKGETLYSIAKKYGLTLKALSDLNPKYAPAYQLKAGDKLHISANSSAEIPAPPATAVVAETPTDTKDTHMVQKGETLYFISKKYGISIRELSDWNNLGDNPAIKTGQLLKIKETLPESTATETVIYTPVSAVSAKTVVKKEAKEAIPSDNPPSAPRTEPAAPVKAITLVPEMPKEVSDKLKNDFTEAAAKNTVKNTLRGVANVVENSELTSASFVLYDDAEMGDIVRVVNLMSKKVMYLKVIGKTKDATDETILQVSSDAAKLLQANEERFLVEVTGY